MLLRCTNTLKVYAPHHPPPVCYFRYFLMRGIVVVVAVVDGGKCHRKFIANKIEYGAQSFSSSLFIFFHMYISLKYILSQCIFSSLHTTCTASFRNYFFLCEFDFFFLFYLFEWLKTFTFMNISLTKRNNVIMDILMAM